MADKSSIEWTDATWNPIRGCSRISPGCTNCYAERMAARGLPGMNSPTTGEPFAIITPSGPRWTGKVELIESQLKKPLQWRKPRRIFVNSISDTFHKDVPDEWIDRIWAVMALCPQHTFMVLTKRADRMREYMTTAFMCNRVFKQMVTLTPERGVWGWPGMMEAFKHIWLGVSVEDKHRTARIDDLRATPANVRFLSVEPLLEDLGTLDLTGISLVIVGGESGPGARPCSIEWIRSIVQQCAAFSVPCFVKQLGSRPQRLLGILAALELMRFADRSPDRPEPIKLDDSKGGDMREWPADLRVREMPEVDHA